MSRRKVPAIALALALVAALVGLITYTSSGRASADEPSCTINECDNNAPIPDEATLRPALQTNENGAYFWTGRVNGTSVEADALRIAQADNGTTLEGALAAANIVMPVFADRTPEAIAAWELASRLFAEQASGDVFVVMGTELREGNVFETLEFPALRANQNVRRVIQVEPENGGEVRVLFDRNDPGNGGDGDGGNPGNGEGDGNGDGEPDEDPPAQDPPAQDPAPGDGEGDPDEGDDAATFSIQGKASGKCVDLAEVENGANPTLQDCNGTERQLFFLDGEVLKANLGGTEFCFEDLLSGREKLQVARCIATIPLKWTFEPSTAEWHANGTNTCMDARRENVDVGTEVIIFECAGRANQQWSNIQ